MSASVNGRLPLAWLATSRARLSSKKPRLKSPVRWSRIESSQNVRERTTTAAWIIVATAMSCSRLTCESHWKVP